MSRDDPLVRLRHMLDFARQAEQMIAGSSLDALRRNSTLNLAITRLVEIIGEAATHVPSHLRDRYPGIPWSQIVAMRNRLVHGYDVISEERLWDTLIDDIPELIPELERAIELESADGISRT